MKEEAVGGQICNLPKPTIDQLPGAVFKLKQHLGENVLIRADWVLSVVRQLIQASDNLDEIARSRHRLANDLTRIATGIISIRDGLEEQ